MKIKMMYGYDANTLEYTGEIPTTLDPRASAKANTEVWLIPANSTEWNPLQKAVPPSNITIQDIIKDNQLIEGYCFVFNQEQNYWDIKEDYRKQEIYDTTTKQIIKYTDVGSLSDNLLLVKDLPYNINIMSYLDYADQEFVIDSKKDEVIQLLTTYRKNVRNTTCVVNIIVDGVECKADDTSCSDYERIITLDITTNNWVSVDGTTRVMNKTIAKNILLAIQVRKEEKVLECAREIKSYETASSTSLIKSLQKVFNR